MVGEAVGFVVKFAGSLADKGDCVGLGVGGEDGEPVVGIEVGAAEGLHVVLPLG